MIHPDTELRPVSPTIGLGVFATRRLPRGTITWVGDALDRRMSAEAAAALPPLLAAQLERYTWRAADGDLVLAWDLARFVNHCCAPNCLTTRFGFEIAVRDIEAGDELSNDYADLGLAPDERFACACGHPACRGRVGPEDATPLRSRWARLVEAALAELPRVAQPLAPLLSREMAEALVRVPEPSS